VDGRAGEGARGVVEDAPAHDVGRALGDDGGGEPGEDAGDDEEAREAEAQPTRRADGVDGVRHGARGAGRVRGAVKRSDHGRETQPAARRLSGC
jgi:hypothetical protein